MMEQQQVRLHFSGPDMYCPWCGRWLVRINGDGSHDLAGKSSGSFQSEREPDWTEDGALLVYVHEAFCLHKRCRLRRWWSSRNLQGGA